MSSARFSNFVWECRNTSSGYSYRERADRFVRDLTLLETERLRAASRTIPYTTLQEQVHSVAFTQAELLVTR